MLRDARFDPRTYTLEYCDQILRDCPEGALRLQMIGQEIPVHRIYNAKQRHEKKPARRPLRKAG